MGQGPPPEDAGPSSVPLTLGPSLPTASPSPSTQALISLTQDISALVSLSLEATASLVHDWFRASLCSIGLGGGEGGPRPVRRRGGQKGENGRGYAVVVIGAVERESGVVAVRA